MRPWLLVSGDFIPVGGMDAANHALARYLAAHAEVHLVAHQVSADLEALTRVSVHRVRRPWNSHALGAPLIARAGRRWSRRLGPRDVHVVVNGGNCCVSGANWVHYVHAAYTPVSAVSIGRRVKTALTGQRDLADERCALHAARLVICNSQRTHADVIERVGVDPSRAHVVYYGADPSRLGPVAPAERESARAAFQITGERPVVGFVGALGDRRKAFDVLFSAWVSLCQRPDWDGELVVVGSGAELPAWQARAAREGVNDRIRFLRYRHDVPELMAGFDLLVHPARYEAYGLSVHEALCRGIPALVSASAGIAERIPPGLADLLITAPDNVEYLVERLQYWRRERQWFRETVAPFSMVLRSRTWDDMSRELVKLVEDAA
jgi:glycosyltransferase involved in cell wall biosynthesis